MNIKASTAKGIGMRTLYRVYCLVALVLLGLPGVGQASGKDPVVFVHGLLGTTIGFDDMINFFADPANKVVLDNNCDPVVLESVWTKSIITSRNELFTFTYNYATDPVDVSARQLGLFIDIILRATGKKRVDIIAHSLGSTVSRYYLKNIPGAQNKVDAWVSMGGPNKGCDGWNYLNCCMGLFWSGCCVMNPTLMTYFNYPDPTPQTSGFPRYITIRSNGDENAVLEPPAGSGLTPGQYSVELDGAVNIITDTYRIPLNMDHYDYLSRSQTDFWKHIMYYIHDRNVR